MTYYVVLCPLALFRCNELPLQNSSHHSKICSYIHKHRSSRLAYLSRILQTKKSIKELKKWNLLEQVENIRIAEDARKNQVESAQYQQLQLQLRPSSDSGRLVVDRENRWSTFFFGGRMMLSTVVVAVLSVRPLLHILETIVIGKGGIELNIFSGIAVIDIQSAAQSVLSPLKETKIFDIASASVCDVLLKAREIPHKIIDFLSGYGFRDFEYPTFLSNLQQSEWNILKNQLEWQKSVATLWVPQIMTLGALALGPLLLWYRAMSSTSKAVCAVGDVFTVGEALDDANFNSAFPLLFSRFLMHLSCLSCPVVVPCPVMHSFLFSSESTPLCLSGPLPSSPLP